MTKPNEFEQAVLNDIMNGELKGLDKRGYSFVKEEGGNKIEIRKNDIIRLIRRKIKLGTKHGEE